MPDSLHAFLSASLAAIKRDAAACADAMATALGPTVVDLTVDCERVVIRTRGDVVVRRVLRDRRSAEHSIVHVSTTARVLVDLVNGDDELLAAVIANRIRVRAAMRDAERLFDVMRWFVEANARSSAAPALFAEYHRQSVRARTGGRRDGHQVGLPED